MEGELCPRRRHWFRQVAEPKRGEPLEIAASHRHGVRSADSISFLTATESPDKEHSAHDRRNGPHDALIRGVICGSHSFATFGPRCRTCGRLRRLLVACGRTFAVGRSIQRGLRESLSTATQPAEFDCERLWIVAQFAGQLFATLPRLQSVFGDCLLRVAGHSLLADRSGARSANRC